MAEKHFIVNGMAEDEKVEDIADCFAREGLVWFQHLDSHRSIKSWEELKALLLNRFIPSLEMVPDKENMAWDEMVVVKKGKELIAADKKWFHID